MQRTRKIWDGLGFLLTGLGLFVPPLGCSSAREGAPDSGPSERSTASVKVPSSHLALPGLAKASATKHPAVERVIVKLENSGARAVVEDTERWLASGRRLRDAVADGDDSLERRFKKLGVSDVRALLRERVGMRSDRAKQAFQSRLAASQRRHAARTTRSLAALRPAPLPDVSNVYVLTLPAGADAKAAASELARDPHVVYAQPDFEAALNFAPNDPFFSSVNSWGQGYDDLWGLKRMGLGTAWDTSQGENVTVGVVDTGVDMAHPEIAANIWVNTDEIAGNGSDDDNNGFVDDVRGWDFASFDNDPSDGFGHGTHVAGTIAAAGNNAQGIIGVAPRARVMPVRAFDSAGFASQSWLASGVIYAAQNGADVINNSWACIAGCPSNPLVEDAVAIAYGLGAVVVMSSGNNAIDIQNFSPQNRPNVIVVGASDQNDQRTSFSNFGTLDVGAPGGGLASEPAGAENVLSLRSSSCSGTCAASLLVGTNLFRLAGTSMAAPHVAGLAALIVKQNPSYSPEEVRQVIRRSAVDVAPAGFDPNTGYGRASASRALLEPRPLAALVTSPLGELRNLAQVDVNGSAFGPGFASYRVDVGSGDAPSTFTQLASSTAPVNAARLATWNLSNVADGRYTLRVSAVTSDGRTYEDRQRVTVDNVRLTFPTSTTFARSGAVVTLVGSAAPPNFSRFAVNVRRSNGTLLPGANVVLVGNGQQPVPQGNLADWNTAGVPLDSYTLELVVTLTTGATVVETSPIIAVDPALRAGFPFTFNATFRPDDHLTAADVNRDGGTDLVLGVGQAVWVLDGSGLSLPGWPQFTTDFFGRAPAVADLTGDGSPEVIASALNGRIHVFGANGGTLAGWPFSFSPDFGGPYLAVDDIDGNGTREIAIGENSVHVLRTDGTQLDGFPALGSLGVSFGQPAIGDVQNDGSGKEIAVATRVPAGNLYLLSSTGAVMPGWPRPLPTVNASGSTFQSAHPVLGDLDGDGDLEIVIGGQDGSVHAFHHTGAPVSGWPRPTQSELPQRANTPSLGDLDGDGRLDVVVGSIVDRGTQTGAFTNDLNAWRGNGTALPGFPVQRPHTFSNDGFAAAALADIDGDGALDAIAWNDPDASTGVTRSLTAFRRDGTVLGGFPKLTPAIDSRGIGGVTGNPSVPAVGDFDRDGLLELAYVDQLSKLFVWDLTASSSSVAPWPMFQQNSAHTGRAAAPATQPAGLSAIATITSNWQTGYCVDIRVANAGPGTVTSWTVVVNLNQSTMNNNWSANFAPISGSSWRVTPLFWNSTIAPGGSWVVGFCGNKTGPNFTPTITSVN